MPTWIERMFRRECVRRLSAWAIVGLLTVLLLTGNLRYGHNFLYGPFATTDAELGKITDPNSAEKYFVKVSGSRVVNTGLQEIEVETRNGAEESRHVTAGYYALQVGDRFLIVKSSKPIIDAASGELVFLTGDIYNNLKSSVGVQRLQQHFYPLMLKADGFRDDGYLAIGFAVLVLLGLFFFARPAWTRLRDLSRHPSFQRIKAWGEIQSSSMEAENEFNNSVRYKSYNIRLTDRFAFNNSFFTFNMFRFQDLWWGYKQVTQRRVNFIPVGKTYGAILVFNGGSVTATGKQDQVDEMLKFAAARTPWAVFGYSDQLKSLLKKNPSDFYAQVEARRQKMTAK
jgi:hypothetical protein